MADSNSSEFLEKEYVLYKDRPEWKDVKPIPQDDSENPIVAISYSEQFQDVYDYFRAILQSSEKSERALKLTEDAIDMNPANYTVWQYRREILKSLKEDLNKELLYIERIIKENPKNYQVWHHRRIIVEWLNNGKDELNFTAKILTKDAKNYHAWQHRQWSIKTFNLFENELDYVNQLLHEDLRNNSAWNHRYFIINNTTGFTEDVLKSEVEYALNKINITKENESAWNYLRGLLLHENGVSKNAAVQQFCEELYTSGNRSPFLLAMIVDMCSESCAESEGGSGDSWLTKELGKLLCDELATEYDTIREKYWKKLSNDLEQTEQNDS